MVTSIKCLHEAIPQSLPRVQKPRFRGFLRNGKIFRSISVSLMMSSVDTSSKRGMVKDEETAGVTEHIIPIPWIVLRLSKIMELRLALVLELHRH